MGKTIHQGKNIKCFREMLNIKQEYLANELGEGWSQRKISILEQKEEIDKEILAKIAQALKLPTEAIKQFDTEMALQNLNEYFHEVPRMGNFYDFNKSGQVYFSKIISLYERMLDIEHEKNELLLRLINGTR